MDATITRNLQSVRSRLDAAARRAGRDPSAIRLIAVSKTFGSDAVRAANAAGQQDFGENKVQEGLQKIGDTADITIRWHLIGHLQSNKAKKAATSFHCIHSIDSVDLLRKVDTAAAEGEAAPEILIQVDLAGEDDQVRRGRRPGPAHSRCRAGAPCGSPDRPDADSSLERGSGTDPTVVRAVAGIARCVDLEGVPRVRSWLSSRWE